MKKKCEDHITIKWTKYNFSEDVDIIERKCRICGESFLFLREKRKEKKNG